MESEKISEKQEEILSILEEKFPSLPPREDIINILQETQFSAQGEWLSPSSVAAPEQGWFMGRHAARARKVSWSGPSFSSLLFVLGEDFQARNVSSPGRRRADVRQALL